MRRVDAQRGGIVAQVFHRGTSVGQWARGASGRACVLEHSVGEAAFVHIIGPGGAFLLVGTVGVAATGAGDDGTAVSFVGSGLEDFQCCASGQRDALAGKEADC